MTYEDGEHIHLHDIESGGSTLDWEAVVKGHVSAQKFFEAITPAKEDYEAHYDTTLEFADPKKMYARWEMCGHNSADGETQALRIYADAGRGKFPVTVAENMDVVRRREQMKENQQKAREFFRELYPDAAMSSLGGGHPGYSVTIKFTFPGGEYAARLHWYPDKEPEVYIANADQEAWQKYIEEGGQQ